MIDTEKGYEFNLLSLYAGEYQQNKRSPKLTYGIRKGYPRIIYYHNQKPNGTIHDNRTIAAMDMFTFYSFINLIKTVIEKEGVIELKINNYNRQYDSNGNVVNERALVSTTIVGKDDAGKVYIALEDVINSIPPVRFYILRSNWHEYVDQYGNAIPEDKIYKLMAKSYVKLLEDTFAYLFANMIGSNASSYTTNNGNNRNNNNQQNTPKPVSASTTIEEDDIPF